MEKKYYDLLNEYIKASGFTLREISFECHKRGQKVDPSYISKLQNGRLPPPSEELSKILAEVLGCNPDILVYRGYLEKAPKFIRQILPQNYSELFSFIKRMSKLPPKYREKMFVELEWLETLSSEETG